LFFFIHLLPSDIYTLSLHDALPISAKHDAFERGRFVWKTKNTARCDQLCYLRCGQSEAAFPKTEKDEGLEHGFGRGGHCTCAPRSEEHTSELQSRGHLVCRLLLEKK